MPGEIQGDRHKPLWKNGWRHVGPAGSRFENLMVGRPISVEELMEGQSNPSGRTPLEQMKQKMALIGKVTRIELSGAVIDVGAERDGLLHISAMGQDRVNRVQDMLQVGQEINVWVRKVDARKGELQLTLVQPLAYDWNDLKPGMTVHGTVSRVEKFGVFVDFGSERPGLIHISELSNEYVKDTASVARVGDPIDAVILEVNRQKRQIHLSRKALESKPSAPEEEEPAESEPEVKPITAMEAAFRKAQTGDNGKPAVEIPRKRSAPDQRRRQQEEILNRTLGTAPKK
jgi:small subunit ribosomal protein S1